MFLDFECDSDHRIIISEMITPKTKKARWKNQEKSTVHKPNPKALNEKLIKKVFLQAVAHEMKINNKPTETEGTNSNIKGFLDSAVDSTLPKIKRKMKTKEIRKNDQALNLLIEQSPSSYV